MTLARFSIPCLLAVSVVTSGQTLQTIETFKGADPLSCTTPPISNAFVQDDMTVNAYMFLSGMNTNGGDVVQLGWLGPKGTVTTTWGATTSGYSNWCFSTDLSIAQWITPNGFGNWQIQAYVNKKAVGSPFGFQIAGSSGGSSGPPVITGLDRSQFTPGNLFVTVYGSNFKPGAVMNVDYYRGPVFQWNVAPSVATTVDSQGQLRVQLTLPDAGEFHLTVKNPDQQQSPSTTIFVGFGGYKLPYPSGQSWRLTQGNDESCSDGCDHNGSLAYAYDFSNGDNNSSCVVAMKSGYAYTHDKGGQQSSDPTDPGNYINIDHGNGEYSHYFHLQTGTFTITNGQWVEQGQSLGIQGNSGHTLPSGRGYHVHVQVTRSLDLNGAQSVPFLFEDVNSPTGVPPGQPASDYTPYLSSNFSSRGVCNVNLAPTGPSEADIAWSAIRSRAASDSRFGSEISGSEYLDPNWGDGSSSMRDLRSIFFNFSQGRTVKIFHAFYNNGTSNLGATIFFDPDTSAWAPWTNVQP